MVRTAADELGVLLARLDQGDQPSPGALVVKGAFEDTAAVGAAIACDPFSGGDIQVVTIADVVAAPQPLVSGPGLRVVHDGKSC